MGFVHPVCEFPMKCPACPDVTLLMTERQGVEIDYCPHCRGVWLDRGELDKFLDRGGLPARPAVAVQARPDFVHSGHRADHDQQTHGRKKSWLSELFD
jgi:Zn-finger nucleic acid-binding protein